MLKHVEKATVTGHCGQANLFFSPYAAHRYGRLHEKSALMLSAKWYTIIRDPWDGEGW